MSKRDVAVFAALGDPTRLKLVNRLAEGPRSITELAHGSGVTRQAIAKHLHVLAKAGLARSTRRGRESLWELEPAPLDDARRTLDLIGKQWDRALERLRRFVER